MNFILNVRLERGTEKWLSEINVIWLMTLPFSYKMYGVELRKKSHILKNMQTVDFYFDWIRGYFKNYKKFGRG